MPRLFPSARLANQTAEIIDMTGEPPVDTLVDDGYGIMVVQGLEMGAGHLEIEDPRIGVEGLIKQAGGILDELGLVAVEFGTATSNLFVIFDERGRITNVDISRDFV